MDGTVRGAKALPQSRNGPPVAILSADERRGFGMVGKLKRLTVPFEPFAGESIRHCADEHGFS
jgi:hypothetical protein